MLKLTLASEIPHPERNFLSVRRAWRNMVFDTKKLVAAAEVGGDRRRRSACS
ncbi:hypothetical protein GJ654_11355 [Rhodoblastus acidophilus]|uniref:Uncharacterized protein n=1 Tax=Rhodoblastus acidophilus TaxID=1074 RepID=A0A6N8DM34_RHOAC|nr:hypothetical protein [Rhodoblastus acidophilus]MCW2276541.1 hypothetical protein [Rhodoblastus acidophilus]MTV31590.1 hypothetical protein [Rhodoblastus acidophilus]